MLPWLVVAALVCLLCRLQHVYLPADSMGVAPSCLLSCGDVQIAGTPDQTLTALKMMTDKLRAVTPPYVDRDRGMHHEYGGRDSPADKRIRGDGRGDGPPSGTYLPVLHTYPLRLPLSGVLC